MIIDVVTTMKALLVEHLDSALSIQDGHASDGSLSQPVRSILIGDEAIGSYGYPAVVIRPESMAQEEFATAQKNARYTISIGCVATHTDQVVAQRLLWRLMRAVENVFEAYGPGESPIIEYRTISMDFSAGIFELDEDNRLEKGGVIVCEVLERLTAYTKGQI